jgi:quinol-cytochrome oxidoreductase complex cytochrome b subunit
MTLPSTPPDNAAESRIHTSHKRRHHARPFQFGLGSLFVVTAAVAGYACAIAAGVRAVFAEPWLLILFAFAACLVWMTWGEVASFLKNRPKKR